MLHSQVKKKIKKKIRCQKRCNRSVSDGCWKSTYVHACVLARAQRWTIQAAPFLLIITRKKKVLKYKTAQLLFNLCAFIVVHLSFPKKASLLSVGYFKFFFPPFFRSWSATALRAHPATLLVGPPAVNPDVERAPETRPRGWIRCDPPARPRWW